MLVHLLGARRAVVVAEYAEQRAGEIHRHVHRRDGRLGVELLLAHHYATTPEFGAGVDVLSLAGIDEGVAATRAGAENADLSVVIGLRPHPLHGGLCIADHLAVGDAALGAYLGGDVVRVPIACPLIEVGADREITVMRKPTRRFNIELAPAREMMNKHHAGKWSRTRWLGHISRNRGSLVALDGHVLADHASVE